MPTSANVIEYDIIRGDKRVGHFRKNIMCRLPEYSDLLEYQPLNEHTIYPYGYDMEEELWEDDGQNLEDYLRKLIPMDDKVRDYFKELDK